MTFRRPEDRMGSGPKAVRGSRRPRDSPLGSLRPGVTCDYGLYTRGIGVCVRKRESQRDSCPVSPGHLFPPAGAGMGRMERRWQPFSGDRGLKPLGHMEWCFAQALGGRSHFLKKGAYLETPAGWCFWEQWWCFWKSCRVHTSRARSRSQSAEPCWCWRSQHLARPRSHIENPELLFGAQSWWLTWYRDLEMSADTRFSACRILPQESTGIARRVSAPPRHGAPQTQLAVPGNLESKPSCQGPGWTQPPLSQGVEGEKDQLLMPTPRKWSPKPALWSQSHPAPCPSSLLYFLHLTWGQERQQDRWQKEAWGSPGHATPNLFLMVADRRKGEASGEREPEAGPNSAPASQHLWNGRIEKAQHLDWGSGWPERQALWARGGRSSQAWVGGHQLRVCLWPGDLGSDSVASFCQTSPHLYRSTPSTCHTPSLLLVEPLRMSKKKPWCKRGCSSFLSLCAAYEWLGALGAWPQSWIPLVPRVRQRPHSQTW